jgi:1-acyl-sn-glycerol-3-phosphate acyltransferase
MTSPDKETALLASKRFLPFFVTQFLGAFNDNVFKNALVIMIAITVVDGSSDFLINLCAGLFILPFLLFSAQAGQIAEKFEKSGLIRKIKLLEIAIMGFAATGFVLDSQVLLIGSLFLMGLQSTIFGPVKYSLIPQHLREEELVQGNGLVEMGTFLAILLGTVTGGILIAQDQGRVLVAGAIIVLAILGWWSSRGIPQAKPGAPDLKIGWNPLKETVSILKMAREHAVVFRSVLGISWFWMMGAVYLTQLPNYTRQYLGGDEFVITLLLAVFSLGIGVGSLLCDRLSGHKVEIGLVPFGSIGLCLFGFDLYFAANLPHVGDRLAGPMVFVANSDNWRVIADLAFIGIFGGFYIVPLYALIQSRTAPDRRSRVIAANNVLNALFMVGSAILAMLVLGPLGLSIPVLFLFVAGLNVAVAGYIYGLVPEFLWRFVVWMLTSTIYRVRGTDLHNIPDEGPVLLVANHVSYVDALIITAACHRPVRFVMDADIYNKPFLNWIFRLAGTIPILPEHKDSKVFEKAFQQIDAYLKDEEVVLIFPEGKITVDGEINDFKRGVTRILSDNRVPVVPLALKGLWGSKFSFADRLSKKRWFKTAKRNVEVLAGEMVSPVMAEPEFLRTRVVELRGGTR